jgi:integrase
MEAMRMAAQLEKTRHRGIYKRGSRYVVRYRVNGAQRQESARTLEEAQRMKRARETDRDRGEFEAQSRIPLREYAEEWIDRYQGNGRRGFTEATRDDYRRDLRWYAFPFLDEKLGRTVSSLSARDVANWIAWLCDGAEQGRRRDELKRQRAEEAGQTPPKSGGTLELSDATVRRIVSPIRACLSTAKREGLIRHNPADGAVLPVREQIVEDTPETARALTRAQLATFLDLVPKKHRLMFRLMAATGVRWSEFAALRWSDLQLDGSAPHLRVRRAIVRGIVKPPKSKHGRRDVPLSSCLVDELRQARKETEWAEDDSLVFPASNGQPLRQENVRRRILQPAAEEADVSWIGFHAFRHTAASLLFERGANAVQVQRWLGHHSPAFTLSTYVHLLDEGVGDGLSLDKELTDRVSDDGELQPPGRPAGDYAGDRDPALDRVRETAANLAGAR